MQQVGIVDRRLNSLRLEVRLEFVTRMAPHNVEMVDMAPMR